jgi:2,4-dienoyl-CoA reductase-like NADH-dependent reductase (Old Yellow Enzyme family)
LASYGPLVKNNNSSTLLVLNAGLTLSEADGLIKEGKIDAAAFGRLWINNPDLQKRFEKSVPLETRMDWFGLYSFKEDPNVGYTDYPVAT